MRNWSLPLICSLGAALGACRSRDDAYDQLVRGSISYPFYEPTRPLGTNGKEDKFVIRSTAPNGTEYAVEIPQAASEYEVEVPLASGNGPAGSGGRGPGSYKTLPSAQMTDAEIVGSMPRMSEDAAEDRAVVDQAFGVGEVGGPSQSPSYTLGLARINDYYRDAKMEYALIEINNLLNFYPNSVKLHKMKGTVLLKLGSLFLAERSWIRAAELAPQDLVIRKGLDRLRKRLEIEAKLVQQQGGKIIPDSGPNAGMQNYGPGVDMKDAVPTPEPARGFVLPNIEKPATSNVAKPVNVTNPINVAKPNNAARPVNAAKARNSTNPNPTNPTQTDRDLDRITQ